MVAISAEIIDPPEDSDSPKRQHNPESFSSLAGIIMLQLDNLRTHRKTVLEQDIPESIHKIRVATRRLQVALDLLYFKEAPCDIKGIRNELKAWRNALSRLRNYDVFIGIVDAAIAKAPRKHKIQYEQLRSLLQKRRLRRAEKAHRFLAQMSIDYIETAIGLTRYQKPEADNSSKEDAYIPWIDGVKVAGRAAVRLDQRVDDFLKLTNCNQSEPDQVHQLRIAGKRLRYLIEMIGELGIGKCKTSLRWLRSIQDKIGDMHDLDALQEEVVVMISKNDFLPENMTYSGDLMHATARILKRKSALSEKLFPFKVPKALEAETEKVIRALKRSYRGTSTK